MTIRPRSSKGDLLVNLIVLVIIIINDLEVSLLLYAYLVTPFVIRLVILLTH